MKAKKARVDPVDIGSDNPMDPSRSSIGAHGISMRMRALPEATTEDRNVHGMVVHVEVYRSCPCEPLPRIPPGHAMGSLRACHGQSSCRERRRSALPDAGRFVSSEVSRSSLCQFVRVTLNVMGLVSATQAQALDERTVALDLDALQVLEHPTALADEEQQATT
ncbi:hypothetical protein GCM10009689_15320 [Brevibacterium antiquum]